MRGENTGSSRDAILEAVRHALPKPAVDLPAVPTDSHENSATGGVGYRGDLSTLEEVRDFPQPGESLVPYFQRHLNAMGGQSFTVDSLAAAQAKVHELFPNARQLCSAVPELPEARRVTAQDDPHSLEDIEVAVVRSQLGIAEAGAVWLTEANLIVPSLGVLT